LEAETRKYNTIYIGGGTPTCLPPEKLRGILCAAAKCKSASCEFTVEANPTDVTPVTANLFADSGVNRVSLGVQSALAAERRALGRRGSIEDIEAAVAELHGAGITNLSFDVMVGIPGQTEASLNETLQWCVAQDPAHISAYLLEIYPGTQFAKHSPALLPDEEAQAALYLQMCAFFETNGYMQYEVSNFCRLGFESRHNLTYWNAEEYMAYGPSAHGFTAGRRWHNTEDLTAWRREEDGLGGGFEEYAMLRLRLAEGLREDLCYTVFGHGIPDKMREAAHPLAELGLAIVMPGSIRLTREGFLLSNSVIGKLLS
jgi:oxygen-independent coproporphyrinogen-3 oxidase